MKITKSYYEVQPRKRQQQTVMSKKRVKKEDIKEPCTIFLDQASNTGYSIFDNDSRLFMTGTVRRGRTSLPEYKEKFIKYILELVDEYDITTIFYEEVYDAANMVTTEVLFYLKHAIKDMGYFNRDLSVYGLDHKKWKSNLAKPDKFNFKRKDDKAEIVKWVKDVYPLIALTTQDEFDALGMGISVMIKGKGKKNFYKQARYNKRLPIHLDVYEDVFQFKEDELDLGEGSNINKEVDVYEEIKNEHIQNKIDKMRVHFRRAYAVDGLYEIELNRRKGVTDLFRQFLSFKDALVYVRIPRNYKYWGLLLLEHGKSPEEFETVDNPQGDYILLGCRKKRL